MTAFIIAVAIFRRIDLIGAVSDVMVDPDTILPNLGDREESGYRPAGISRPFHKAAKGFLLSWI